MPASNPLPPKENALFKRILVGLVLSTLLLGYRCDLVVFNDAVNDDRSRTETCQARKQKRYRS